MTGASLGRGSGFGKGVAKNKQFDPKTHLAYRPPTEVIMMKDIGYPHNLGVSPVAVSQPFKLFSSEAIQAMRAEIFSKEVKDKHTFSSNIAANQLRGYASEQAPFTYEAWSHPATLEIVSKIAGVDLVPWGDYEIAHINFSVKSDDQVSNELETITNMDKNLGDDSGETNQAKDLSPIVDWHTDSYPFVCVLMLSDCTNMVGGETVLRTANGGTIKVRGPEEGCAVILQGRYINHQALRAFGAKERITSVTSFRPRSAFVKDDSELRTVRPISNLSELYNDFAEYRLDMLQQRIDKEREEVRVRREAGQKFDTDEHKQFLQEQIAFLKHTDAEMVPDNEVVPGYIEEVEFAEPTEATRSSSGDTCAE